MEANILHADLDAYYASVEQLLDPTLRDRPVAVGGGVVLAASYEAKAYGVTGGMPGRRARELCPGLVIVPGNFGEYTRLADAVFRICRNLTPRVERISIDEAFLDVTGSRGLFGTPLAMATALRQRVRDEIGLSVSVGVARTKFLAKIASQVAKPDGLIVVDPKRETEFLHPLPVSLMWGVGPVTLSRLAECGVCTIGDLAEMPVGSLTGRVGAGAAAQLTALAWNRDPRPVGTGRRPRSVGAQSALGRTRADAELIGRVLRHLADRVGTRLRRKRRAGRTTTVRVRFPDLRSVTRSSTLPAPIAATGLITEVAVALVEAALSDQSGEREISLLGLSISNLVDEPALQLELPLDLDGPRLGSEVGRSLRDVDHSIDAVRERFGRDSVGYASLVLRPETWVPDLFRELAEKND